MTNALPGLAHFFGIRPWDIGRLSARELNRFLEELEDIGREARKRG